MTAFSDNADTERHVAEGDAVIFDLPPVDSCPTASIHWVDARGNQLTRTAQNHHITVTNQLVILNARYDLHNNAVFRATATNGYTQRSSSSPPYILRVQREYTALRRMHSTFICDLSVFHCVCLSVTVCVYTASDCCDI